jgi:hypothetical protein
MGITDDIQCRLFAQIGRLSGLCLRGRKQKQRKTAQEVREQRTAAASHDRSPKEDFDEDLASAMVVREILTRFRGQAVKTAGHPLFVSLQALDVRWFGSSRLRSFASLNSK